jgi:hypothetical protein
MKKFITVLFVLMLSNSAFALGEMGKGDCIYSDNGTRKVEEVVAVITQEAAADNSAETTTSAK